MAFWTFHGGGAMTSTIDTILDKESFELHELLADDELLQECKALNSRLLQYLCKPEVLERLFEYVVVEPSSEDSHDRCYTFPYVSSELLSCEVPQLHDAMVSEECRPLLRRLLSFTAQSTSLNPVLCGYYSKVVSALFKRSPEQLLEILDTEAMFGGRMAFLKMLLQHMHMQSIADLLVTLTTPIDTLTAGPPPPPMLLGGLRDAVRTGNLGSGDEEEGEKAEHWLDAAELGCLLLATVRDSSSAEVHSLSTALFSHLVSSYGWAELVAHPPLVRTVVEVALDAREQSARTAAMAMLTELLRMHATERASAAAESHAARKDEQLEPLLSAVCAQVEGFVSMMNHEQVLAPHLAPFLRDTGIPDCLVLMPVGSARLQLYTMLARLLPVCGAEAQAALAQCRVLDIALDALERYPNNNLLHAQVTYLVTSSLAEEASAELRMAAVRETKLGARLAALAEPRAADLAATNSDLDGLSPGSGAPKRRAPWMGHVLAMANALCACAERDEEVKAALAGEEEWHAFVHGELASANVNERKTLGGQAPTRGSELDDSDEDELFSNKELDLDTMAAALARHHERQGAARSGFDDEDGEGGGGREGQTPQAVSEEVERRFGEYMEQKGFLHELDGGLSAISREQDDEAARERTDSWEHELEEEEEQLSPSGGGGDRFGSRQRDFFGGGGGRGDDDDDDDDGFASLRGADDSRANAAAETNGGSDAKPAGTFDAVFGDFDSAGSSPSPDSAAGSGGGGGGGGDATGAAGSMFAAFEANFDDLQPADGTQVPPAQPAPPVFDAFGDSGTGAFDSPPRTAGAPAAFAVVTPSPPADAAEPTPAEPSPIGAAFDAFADSPGERMDTSPSPATLDDTAADASPGGLASGVFSDDGDDAEASPQAAADEAAASPAPGGAEGGASAGGAGEGDGGGAVAADAAAELELAGDGAEPAQPSAAEQDEAAQPASGSPS